jgi:ferredoxin-NADP reductase/Na+-translocating ferredoxin:NAD+ oxidoreductase RnfD subunit
MTFIDSFLNRITMYRLVLYYLVALLATAAVFGFFNILPYNPANLAFSTLLLLTVCWITNRIFVKGFGALPNNESVYITALILALIITPVAPTDYAGVGFLIFAAAWAMASKFIFAIGKKHLFNPAAFGVAIAALVLSQAATWWVAGNLPLLPFVVLGGLLIVRKIHRFDLVLAFGSVALLTTILTSNGTDPITAITQTLLHSAIFFLAFAMLTEPLTMPPSRVLRILYGALVGFLFVPNVHIGSIYFTPEIALLIGNVFAYIVSPKGRFMLTLIEKKELAANTYEFVFAPDHPLTFRPGQYIEWTLAHRFADNRGNRRYFTIASSPTENVVRLGVKFYKPASTFKRALWAMQEKDTISVSHVAGDFTLPRDAKKKVVCIAGGIGVTPFRSMVQYLVDTKDTRAVTLLYANRTAAEIAYKDVFDKAAESIPLKTVYALSDEPSPLPGMYAGLIDAAMIAREIPDYKDCIFYISGPHGMVNAFTETLHDMGISRFNIKTDYFPGFA